jgi:hypothetical protein
MSGTYHHSRSNNININQHKAEILDIAHRLMLIITHNVSQAGAVSVFRRNRKGEEPNLVGALGIYITIY